MESNELLVRIDERQKSQGEDIKEILVQVKATNGRVTKLETYKEMDQKRGEDDIVQLEDHEKRLNNIEEIGKKVVIVDDVAKRLKDVEDVQKTWKIRLAAIAAVFTIIMAVVEIAIKIILG